MDVREVWFGTSIAMRVARVLLLPLSGVYWLGWNTYLLAYRWGLKSAHRSSLPVVVVGNFTVGGTGKSPLVVHISEVLSKLGHTVVIGCSGYGARRSQGASIAPDGPLRADEWGDEPAMIRERLPSVPLVVGRDRVEAAKLVERMIPDAVLLMDDGLQHMPLLKDVRIVLRGSGENRFVLPAGPYREPFDAKRVDAVIPGDFKAEFDPIRFVKPDRSPIPESEWQGKRVSALTAIADPKQFFEALAASGLVVGASLALPDHDPLTEGTLLSSFEPGMPIVATTKDWVKLAARPDASDYEFWIAIRECSLVPAHEFETWIDGKIKEVAGKKIRA